MKSLMKQPSAWIPLVMSLAAFGLVLSFLGMFGVERNEDEGAAARFFQLLLAGQIPIIIYFAIKWSRPKPKQAFLVLLLQAGAGLAALALVFFLERQ